MPDFAPPDSSSDSASGETHGGLLMARAFKEAGIEILFSVCGGHILPLLDGCLETGIRVIDHRHEGAASLTAEGWALATGRTGLAAVTAGPGFANSLTAFLDASVWSVPMVLVAGRTGLQLSGRGAVQDLDQRSIVAPAAKWSATCYQTERIPRTTKEAMFRARSGKPGPVYLEVPQNILAAKCSLPDPTVPAGFPLDMPASTGAREDIERALAVLDRAEQPLVLAGGGAFWSGAGATIARFCEKAKIPVITTSSARGLVPDSHPWCVGTLVHAGVGLLSADVVLVLGSAFNANVMYGEPPLFGPEQTVIQVDIRPEGIGGNRLPQIGIVGDVRHVVRDLADGLGKPPKGREAWLGQMRSLVAASLELWDNQNASFRGSRVSTGAMVKEVAAFAREAAGDRLTFVADGGDLLSWALAYLPAEGPGRMLSTTTALGTLGVGVPFAIAAKAARPDDLVVSVIGDGAFGLTAMEIDTAVRHRLPIVAVVSNNRGWQDVCHEQDAWYGPDRHVASELADTRYDRLAEALGGHGEYVRTLEELRPALKRSVESGLPAVINVAVDPACCSELMRSLGKMGIM